MIWETIDGQVVAKSNNYIAVPDVRGGMRIVKNDNVKRYERAFVRQCTLYRERNIDTAFVLHARVFFPSMACDLDNALKTILDCLQYAKAIKDDNLCMRIDAEKRIDARRPRVEYAIEPQMENMFYQNSF